MYGVHAFLESLGCRFLTDTVNKIPKKTTIVVPDTETVEKPAFEYRDVFIREAMHPDYAARNRCNSANAGLDDKRGGCIAYYPIRSLVQRSSCPWTSIGQRIPSTSR